MKKRLALGFVLLALATAAWPHGGHVHNIMGTVKSVDGDGAVVELKDGKLHTIVFTADTRFTKGAEEATREDVQAGVRVSVHLANDSKTARSVKIGKAGK